MKTNFPRAVVLFSIVASAFFPAIAQSAEYEVDTDVANSSKPWSASTTWKAGSPERPVYPSSPDDDVLAPGRTNGYFLYIDQSEIEIGSLTAAGSGATRRIRAANNQTASFKVDTLIKSGSADLTFENGDGTLSVEIGTLQIGASSNIEVGRETSAFNSIAGFEVTGSTSVAGLFAFNGIAETSGEKRMKLGALSVTGSGKVVIGGRGNSGGILEVSSLSGTANGRVLLTNANHAPSTGTSSGTLEIHSANVTPTTYAGRIVMSDSASFDATGYSLAVHKKGDGVQILSGVENDYNGGTIIEGGVLAVTNSSGSGLGTGEVEVRNGGTLAGSGRIALANEAVVVRSGGVVAPGAHLSTGVATLTLSGAASDSEPILSLENGGTFRFRLGAENASDSIAFTDYQAGGFQIAGTATVDLLNVGAGTYTLFSFDAIDAGEIATLTSSLTLGDGLNGYDGTLGYDATTIYVNVQAIPEPTTTAFLLLGAGAGALSWWRARRK